MKRSISTLAILLLFVFAAKAQKAFHDHQPMKRHMHATTIVGISSLTLGLGGTMGGFFMQIGAGSSYEHNYGNNCTQAEADYQRESNTALAVRDIGMVMGIAGLGMTIAGAIYDHSKHHNRWSLVAPKMNEIGVAYHF